MKRVPCKEEALGFHLGSVKVKGHSKPLRPILLLAYVGKDRREHRLIGLKEKHTLYVVPFSDTGKFFKIYLGDTYANKYCRPMGVFTRKLYADSDNWSCDERFKVLIPSLLNKENKATFNKIQEMLYVFEPLKTWSDLP